MRGLCLVSTMMSATVLAGCASWFNADIYNKPRQPDLVVPTCLVADPTDPTNKPPIPTIPIGKRRPIPTPTELRIEDIDFSVVTAGDTDLAAGMKLLSASAGNDAARIAIKDYFGVDPGELSSQLPFINKKTPELATDALNKLTGERLSDGQDFSGHPYIKEEHEKLVTAIGNATASYAWTASFAKSLGVYAKQGNKLLEAHKGAQNRLAPEDLTSAEAASLGKAAADATITSTFVAYFIAYFRNGEIFDVTFDGSDLKQKIEAAINKNATINGIQIPKNLLTDVDNEIGTYYGDLENSLCKQAPNNDKCTMLGGIGDTTFVTRAGKPLAFQGIRLTLDPAGKKAISTTKPDSITVGEDLIRVAIEASWDSVNPVPGTDNSTLCAVLKVCADPKDPNYAKEKQGVADANSVGDTTEAASAQVVGYVIRGGWLFSLNNEAAAESLTTGISVVARKVAERVAYAHAIDTCNTPNKATPATRSINVSAQGRKSP